ncbi:Tol-Pal system subunit TolQ [candidate division GN15 bacterium]|uniref:Tol-Pal system subunit TolQ n=1 Tax=candidate division GN15 bacterium TaxID=2072418 RepID=A0A855XBE2_9BACT|nr:MAG: Tol-Pal system subunit TolQ [candidate division GN15 bacterium]
MSVISWVVIFHKWRQFRAVSSHTEKFLHHFRRTRKLGEAHAEARSYAASPIANIYRYGVEELMHLRELKNGSASGQSSGTGLTDHEFDVLEMTMEKTMTDEMVKLERQVVYLATTTSAAPFLGLLGTVVGIMDSFWSIGERGSASLAVVAPGIAEALLATIVGLGAAIPAVIAYNWANARTKNLHDRSSGFILDFLARAKKEEI